MTRIIALALAITAGGIAHASDSSGALTLDSATTDQIRTSLTADGYDVRKVEVEDGLYEAYALKDGNRYEIYLDRDLNIVKSERDD